MWVLSSENGGIWKSVHTVWQQQRHRQHFLAITIGIPCNKWSHSHCAATALQVNGFWTYSVWLWQWQIYIHNIHVYALLCHIVWTLSCNCGKKAIAAAVPRERTLRDPKCTKTWAELENNRVILISSQLIYWMRGCRRFWETFGLFYDNYVANQLICLLVTPGDSIQRNVNVAMSYFPFSSFSLEEIQEHGMSRSMINVKKFKKLPISYIFPTFQIGSYSQRMTGKATAVILVIVKERRRMYY